MKCMADLSYTPIPLLPNHHYNKLFNQTQREHSVAPSRRQQSSTITASAAKFGGGTPFNSASKRCDKCRGQGSIDCPGCKGTGRNKKNGNIFERWKCFECQGFGLKSCPECGKGGLTPEQRGER